MELTGPNTSMKRSISLMSHFTGSTMASGSTLSNGIAISETL